MATETYRVELSRQEHSLVLAALRNWQIDAINEVMGNDFADYFEGDDGPCPDDDAIDALVERLNKDKS